MNTQIKRQLLSAIDVVEWLARRGDSVAKIEVSGFRGGPRIELSNRPKDILSVETVEVEDGETRRFRTADISGCRVEWRCD